MTKLFAIGMNTINIRSIYIYIYMKIVRSATGWTDEREWSKCVLNWAFFSSHKMIIVSYGMIHFSAAHIAIAHRKLLYCVFNYCNVNCAHNAYTYYIATLPHDDIIGSSWVTHSPQFCVISQFNVCRQQSLINKLTTLVFSPQTKELKLNWVILDQTIRTFYRIWVRFVACKATTKSMII